MLMDLIATLAAGAGLVGFVIIARHLSKGRLPKWTLPAAIGLGMLLFSIWNEYTWYGRTTGALPEEVIILTTPTDKVFYRPWTYVFPVATRFAAFDGTGMVKSQQDSAFRRGEVLLVQRWTPTRRIPLAFDCAANRRADLIEGVEIAPDGTLTGGDWMDVGAGDELQRAACQEG
ncbi:MAG: hypothetical protein WBA92_16300 [Pseudorhodobacter sp.]